MALTTLVIIFIAVTLAMIIAKIFFKTAYKIIMIIWFVMFLGSLAFGILIYVDVMDIKENMATSDNAFMFHSEGDIKGVIVTQGHSENTRILEDVSEIAGIYEAENYTGLREYGDYYKVFVVEDAAFDSLSGIEVGDMDLTKDEALRVIDSETPFTEMANVITEKGNGGGKSISAIEEDIKSGMNITTDDQIRGLMYALMFSATTMEDSPIFIIDNYRNGNIEIYEETITFKLMKYVPSSMLEGAIKRGE